MSFQCVIVTPEQQVMDERVEQVILPAHDGLVGILTGRAPLLAKLGVGALRVDGPGSQTRTFFVDGGVAQMKDNRLTVVSGQATPAAEITAEAGRAELAQAAAIPVTDDRSAADRERRMQRGRVMQQLAQKG
jgi:F-type H+-transporting ATPase subunit epsilon